MKILLLNGPPSSGKDTLADFLIGNGTRQSFNDPLFWKLKMAEPLKLACKGLYGLSDEEFIRIDSDPILKNQPMDCFLGYSWREVLIAMSETYIKNKHGKQTFGKLLANKIEKLLTTVDEDTAVFVVSDCGFHDEVVPLIEKFGTDAVVLIKIVRPEHDYSGDSRSYVDPIPLGIKQYEIHNKGSMTAYHIEAAKIISQITQ